MEGPKDEYYSSLNTFDHDSALEGYPQLEVLPGPRREQVIRKNEARALDVSCCGAVKPST